MAKRSNKLSQTMDLPLNKIMSMSRAELAKATQTLAKAGNRRLTTMKKAKLSTPATEYIKTHGGKFSTRNKNIYELRTEFQRTKTFLETKTSTVRGFKKWEQKMSDTLMTRTGIDYNSLTKTQKRKFWKAFAKLEELDPANTIKGSANYRTSVNEIYDAVKGGLLMKDIDAFVDNLNRDLYEQSTKDFTSIWSSK